MNWFPFSRKPRISPRDRAILSLKSQRDTLHAYTRRLRPQLALYTTTARTHLQNSNKPAALSALRRKKQLTSLLAQTENHLLQLEQLVQEVEYAAIQVSVMEGLKQGTEVLRRIHGEMGGVEGVERVMGEAGEERERVGEIGDALGAQMSVIEEEEVEEELGALQKEVRREKEGEELPDVPGGTVLHEGDLPGVPVAGVEQSRVPRPNGARVALEAFA